MIYEFYVYVLPDNGGHRGLENKSFRILYCCVITLLKNKSNVTIEFFLVNDDAFRYLYLVSHVVQLNVAFWALRLRTHGNDPAKC